MSERKTFTTFWTPERIREFRESQDLNQTRFGTKIGLSRRSVVSLESGRSRPTRQCEIVLDFKSSKGFHTFTDSEILMMIQLVYDSKLFLNVSGSIVTRWRKVENILKEKIG